AAQILTKAIDEDVKAGYRTGAATKRIALAEVHAARGDKRTAVAEAERAVKEVQSEAVQVPAARIALQGGSIGQARAIATQLGSKVPPQTRAWGKVLEGDVALASGRATDAVRLYRTGQKLADFWLGRMDLAIALINSGNH